MTIPGDGGVGFGPLARVGVTHGRARGEVTTVANTLDEAVEYASELFDSYFGEHGWDDLYVHAEYRADGGWLTSCSAEAVR